MNIIWAGMMVPLMALAIPIVAILGWVITEIVETIRKNPESRRAGLSEDETRIMQDIHHGLARMEQRVEALETLILDKENKQ